jgi:hypothetical protein
MVFVARALVGVILPGNNSSSTAPTATALLASTTVMDLSLQTLSQTVEEITGTPKEIRITDTAGTPLSPQEILQLTGFASSKNFTQTVTDIHIITINAQRALIIKITDPTAALGGLLSWEPLMAKSLQTYFGSTDQSTLAEFRDVTLGTKDARVLTLDGKELVVYGFINNTTILISEDTTSFNATLGNR